MPTPYQAGFNRAIKLAGLLNRAYNATVGLPQTSRNVDDMRELYENSKQIVHRHARSAAEEGRELPPRFHQHQLEDQLLKGEILQHHMLTRNQAVGDAALGAAGLIGLGGAAAGIHHYRNRDEEA